MLSPDMSSILKIVYYSWTVTFYLTFWQKYVMGINRIEKRDKGFIGFFDNGKGERALKKERKMYE